MCCRARLLRKQQTLRPSPVRSWPGPSPAESRPGDFAPLPTPRRWDIPLRGPRRPSLAGSRPGGHVATPLALATPPVTATRANGVTWAGMAAMGPAPAGSRPGGPLPPCPRRDAAAFRRVGGWAIPCRIAARRPLTARHVGGDRGATGRVPAHLATPDPVHPGTGLARNKPDLAPVPFVVRRIDKRVWMF